MDRAQRTIRWVEKLFLPISLGVLLVSLPAAAAPRADAQRESAATLLEKKPVDYTKFNHADHGLTNKKRKLVCADCHILDPKKLGTNVRPGTVGHMPCIECHAQQFFKDKPLKICAVCHRSSNYKTKNKADVPFTTTAFHSQFGLAFSHRSHLDPNRHLHGLNRQYPFNLHCEFCHKLAADGVKRELPSHPQCFVCHAPSKPAAVAVLTVSEREFLPKVIVKMDQCQWCHTSPNMEPKVNIFANRTPSAFKHSARLQEPDPLHPGQMRKVPCESCHKNQREAPSVFSIRLPKNKK